MRADGRRGEPLFDILSRPDRATISQNEIEAAAADIDQVACGKTAALIFHHNRGGGSSKFLSNFEHDMRRNGIEPLRLRLLSKSDRLLVWPGHEPEIFEIADDLPEIVSRARLHGVTRVVVNHLIDFDSSTIFDCLETLVQALDADLWVVIHDYFGVCPRVNLVDLNGRPCAIPPASECARCVAKGGSQIAGVDPAIWRTRFVDFLGRADRIIVPSQDLRQRMSRFVSGSMEVWKPEQDHQFPAVRQPNLTADQCLQVAVLGSLNEPKGSRVVRDLARHIKRAKAPIRIEIYGETDITRQLRAVAVAVHGRYRDSEIDVALDGASPHMILMPAIWPETWSFVLTTALNKGLPVMAFAHGAQFQRLLDLGRTDLLLPLEWFDKPERILGALLRYRDQCVTSH